MAPFKWADLDRNWQAISDSTIGSYNQLILDSVIDSMQIDRSMRVRTEDKMSNRNRMKFKEKFLRFKSKWGKGWIKRSFERKRARREARKNKKHSTVDHDAERLAHCEPLPVFHTPNGASLSGWRLTLVTDSINARSFYGGMGTALIIASEICRHHQATLRIVTRHEPAEPSRLQNALDVYGIQLPTRCELVYCPPSDANKRIDVTSGDAFLTTSWWSTDSTVRSISPDSIHYLIQEDERMFYPYGYLRLRCEAVLQDPQIRLLVNSSLLHEHFVHEGVRDYVNRARFFEPAFPSRVYFPRQSIGKQKLFFYARPHHPRNLFRFGIQVLREAINQGVLNGSLWDIYMVGDAIPGTDLLDGHPYKTACNLKWSEYVELIGQMNVGLSLMYTPHPSYPPLDLVASGAIVVTNRFGTKRDLTRYSNSILCADLDVDSMVQALKTALTAAESRYSIAIDGRRRDYKPHDTWQEALRQIVESFRFN